MELCDSELPLCIPHLLKSKEFEPIAKIIEVQQEEEIFGMDWYDPTCYATEILDAKYEKVEIDEVINKLNHLTLEQKEDLEKLLRSTPNYFMEHWVSIPTENSILAWYLGP